MTGRLRLNTLDATSRYYIAADFLLSARITGLVSSFSILLTRITKFEQGSDSSCRGHGMLVLVLVLIFS